MAGRRQPTRGGPSGRAAYWRGVLAECKNGGLSQAEFARRRGIPPGTLAYWKHHLRKQATTGRESNRVRRHGLFARVRIVDRPPAKVRSATEPNEKPVEIQLVSGRRIRLWGDFDPEILRRLVACLEQPF